MDRLHDREAYYVAEAKKQSAIDSKITVVSVGAGNVAEWSLTGLRNLKAMVEIGKSEYMTEGDCAVYVVGTNRATCTKIGMALSPIKRLAALQTGNPEALFLHRVFWFRNAETAASIERRAHEKAAQKHIRLEGEWFECGPTQAHIAVEMAANELRVDYAVMTPFEETPH
jgi:hypothetical protein